MLAAVRSNDVRIQNRKIVLEAVRRGGIVSRTDIGKSTGLSAATVSAITSDFLQEGILTPPQESKVTTSGRGRPKVALVLNPKAAMICAVYFQLYKVSAAMIDYSGEIICEFSQDLPNPNMTADEIRYALSGCIKQALNLQEDRAEQLNRIYVGIQGVTDVDGSHVIWTPTCVERNFPICDWLETEFGVPAKVANDCNLVAQALNWREPEKYSENFGAVLLAHGVGMGLYLRDNIVSGMNSSAVEFGHMTFMPDGALCRCGNKGCIEAYAGDYAIARQTFGQPENATPDDLLDPTVLDKIKAAIDAGDKNAIKAVEDAGEAIGTGLASLFAILDPFPVVLVGKGSMFYEQMEKSLRKRIDGSFGKDENQHVEIDCYSDVNPLVREGCAISALKAQDEELSNRRVHTEAAE